MRKILKYILSDIIRNRIILAYTLLLLVLNFSVFSLGDSSAKGILSILNIILFIVPLVSIIFATIYIYNSAEFIELLVSQPLQRKTVWMSLFTGIAGALCIAFIIGTGIPVLIFSPDVLGLTLLVCGTVLSIIFSAISMLGAMLARDKAKGIGVAILHWLYFTVLFDALVLFILFQFSDYPVENMLVFFSMLNPVDLCRIIVLLKLDVAALMGYTGALFRNFFGTAGGITITSAALLAWIIFPVWLSLRLFKSKNL